MSHVAEKVVDSLNSSGIDELFGFVVPLAASLGGGALIISNGLINGVVEGGLGKFVGVDSIVEFT